MDQPVAKWKKVFVVALAVFFGAAIIASIGGCASHGVMLSESQVSQIKKGETTEAQLIQALGQPTTVSMYSGQRTLIYSGAHAQARAASFIPIVGPLVGGSDARATTAIFRIKDGIVIDYSYTQSNIGGGTGIAAGPAIAPIQDQPR